MADFCADFAKIVSLLLALRTYVTQGQRDGSAWRSELVSASSRGRRRGGTGAPWRVTWSVHSVNRLGSWEREAFCITWTHPSFSAVVLSAVPGSATSAPPGHLLEMQTLSLHSRPTESQTLGVKSRDLFKQVLQVVPAHCRMGESLGEHIEFKGPSKPVNPK